MRLLEFEAKELLKRYGIDIPNGFLLSRGMSCERIVDLYFPVVIKAQIKAGGRGKAGAIKVVREREKLCDEIDALFGQIFFGQRSETLLLEEFVPHEQEFYLSCAVARKSKKYALMLSSSGGVEVERNAESVSVVEIDPLAGLMPHHVRDLLFQAGIAMEKRNAVAAAIKSVYRLFIEMDAQIVEINPFVVVGEKCVALDGKVIIDDGAVPRHPEFAGGGKNDSKEGETPGFVARMQRIGINMQEQDGDIAILTGGAGRMMATLDLLSSLGGTFRTFGELGTVVFQPEKMRENMKVLLPEMLGLRPKAILLSICWILANCEEFAKALAEVLDEVDLKGIPMIVRICGNKQEEAHRIMSRYTDRVTLETELVDACEAAVCAGGDAVDARNRK